jgi:AmiR/NasT family two-component response regulator
VATNYSPAAVHIAIGVLMELHDCDPPQAIALLSSSAFSSGRTITDLALEIIDDPTCAVVGEQLLGG